MGRALRRIPSWAWLAAIVAVSTSFRAVLARDMVAPFILVDEIIWSEIARGIAGAGEPLIRGEPDPGYSIVYPLLISPVYALFENLVDAYGRGEYFPMLYSRTAVEKAAAHRLMLVPARP